MASVSYYGSNVSYHRVFQPRFRPETHHTDRRFIQIELTIDVDLMVVRRHPITGILTFNFYNTNPFSSQETLRFDLSLLKNHYQVRQVLAPAFTRLGINTASTSYDTVVREIIEHGLGLADFNFNMRYNFEVLPLRSEIRASIVERENSNNNRAEVSIIGRAMAESTSEFERGNYGMIAAKESSVKGMLKRVRVEDREEEEDCMICLEKLNVGTGNASRMPCSHTFHCNCIKKWLQSSHFCPLCRFKMPTN